MLKNFNCPRELYLLIANPYKTASVPFFIFDSLFNFVQLQQPHSLILPNWCYWLLYTYSASLYLINHALED